MKFYCIVDDLNKLHNPESYQLLKDAATARGLDWEVIEASKYDSARATADKLEDGSVLYRLAVSRRAKLIEALLYHEGLRTFYPDRQALLMRGFTWGSTIAMLASGLPVVPTIFGVNAALADKLDNYVQRLGGYPVILKSAGGSHGSGVMRVDSIESLRSVVGFVAGPDSADFVLRQYIANARHIRCVVLGDDVVDAIEYLPVNADFRTNAVAVPQVKAFGRDENIFSLAVRAVAQLSVAFGGVDILISQEGRAYIAEVNFPCNFARNQLSTGVDIAGQMVGYLTR